MHLDSPPCTKTFCTHPPCLLAYVGPDINLDDTSAVCSRLQSHGFSSEQQEEIAHELKWAWIEQCLAVTKYLAEGVWDGPECEVHGNRTERPKRQLVYLEREQDRYDEVFCESSASSTDDIPLQWTMAKPSSEADRDSLYGAELDLKHSHDPLTAENLAGFDRTKLECEAERIAMSVQFDNDCRSQVQAQEPIHRQAKHHPLLQLAGKMRVPAGYPPSFSRSFIPLGSGTLTGAEIRKCQSAYL